jgi:hypothetical protein
VGRGFVAVEMTDDANEEGQPEVRFVWTGLAADAG